MPAPPSHSFEGNTRKAFNLLHAGRIDEGIEVVASIPDKEVRKRIMDGYNKEIEQKIEKDVAANPVAVMDAMLAEDSVYEVVWLEVALREYLSHDHAAAMAWVEVHEASLTPEQADRVALALSRDALDHKKLDEAQKWNERIQNETLRQVTHNEYLGGQERMIREAMVTTPNEMLDSMIDGTSGLEEFWIEVAMDQYMKSDEEAAWKWYLDHKSQLTMSQEERIALAYGRAALKQKNIPTAQKWAALIVDDTLRGVLEEEIAKCGE